MSYNIYPMTVEDIPQVREIEEEAFPGQSPRSFERDLENKRMRFIIILEEQDCVFPAQNKTTGNRRNIVGYAGVWFMVDEAHIIDIAVKETHRRNGLGETLLISLLDMTRQHNMAAMILEVRVSNLAAQSLYEKYGFTRLLVRKHYYTNNGEDALLMKLEGITSPSYWDFLRDRKDSSIRKNRSAEGF